MANSLLINDADNVVVLLEDVKAGETVTVNMRQGSYVALEDIRKGHKMAIADIKKGEQVVKFGITIGPMISDIKVGGLISVHNLLNDSAAMGERARKKVRESVRTFMGYPRPDGQCGIRNYVMVIATSPECNDTAEAISNATGCTWMCCDRTHLEEGRVSRYTRMALGYTTTNPNLHSVVILKADGEKATADYVLSLAKKTKKPAHYLDITAAGDASITQGTAVVKEYMAAAAAEKRVPCPIEALTVVFHNNGSDWTTAIIGNPVVGKAVDHLVKDGAKVLFPGGTSILCGIEDRVAEMFAKRSDALRMLDIVEAERESVLKRTGKPMEYEQPNQVNLVQGITTLIEKGYYALTVRGSTPIQGYLDYCERPPHGGQWNNFVENGLPPTSSIFGSLQGAQLHIFTSSVGYLYHELPHLVGVRVTGNEDSYNTKDFKMDFNAGKSLHEGIPATGEKLYQYLIDVASGLDTTSEPDKQKAFHMWYYIPIAFYEGSDRSKSPPFYHAMDAAAKLYGEGFVGTGNNSLSLDYKEAVRLYTERVK